VRHGTTSLFAALDVASGFLIGKCYKRHRAVEFLKFLKEIDAQIPEGLDVPPASLSCPFYPDFHGRAVIQDAFGAPGLQAFGARKNG
jgi:hypothetical protein